MTDQQQEGPSGGTPSRSSRSRLPSGFATIRDIIAFAAGLLIVGNEVFISKTAEPAVIAVGVAMLGLPAVFGADERKRKGDDEQSTPPEDRQPNGGSW